MDKTVEYINMCLTSKEIRDKREDFNDSDYNYVALLVENEARILCVAKDAEININIEKEYQLVWMPTQSQLMKLAFEESKNPIKALQELTKFHENFLWVDLNSIEKLLFTFIMYKHGKVWKSDKSNWEETLKEGSFE